MPPRSTGERLSVLETDVRYLREGHDKFEEKLDSIGEKIDALTSSINIKKGEDKQTAKLWGIGSGVVAAIISNLVPLPWKH